MDNYEDIYKSICRVCLSGSKSENMVSLLDVSSADGLSCYGKSVTTFANISINFNDKFPKSMCKNCLILLKQAIRFKLKCETSDTCLKKLINVNRKSTVDCKDVICEYTIFKHYFPEVCSTELTPTSITGKSKDESKKSHDNIGERHKKFDYTITSRNSLVEQNIDSISTLDDHLYNKQTKNEKTIFDSDDLFDKLENIVNSNHHFKSSDKVKNNYKDLRKNQCRLIENNILPKRILYKQKDRNFKNKNRVNMLKHVPEKKNSSNKCIDPEMNKQSADTNKNKQLKQQQDLPQKNINCQICNKVLANLQTYRHHMQRHNGCRYICDSCGKGFPTNAELNLHQVALHGTGAYLQCNYCSFKAPRRLNLIEHIRLHTGERPYTCDKCGMTFRRQAIWSKHVIRHTERNVQCLKCPKKFFLQQDMLAHMNNIHERLYVFMCNKCGVTYAKTKTVRRHLSQKHGIPREMQGKIIRVKKGVDVQFPNK